jgi:hypothetical protein
MMRRGVIGFSGHVLAAMSLGACVFGYRGEAGIEAVYPLEEIAAVRVDLGASPLTVVGDEQATGLELRGTWQSVGGSAKIARAQASGAALEWASDGAFAELRLVVPLELRGQIDFEADEIRLPPDRDLELVTALGDVYVAAVDGNLSVDVGAGHVTIDGAGADGLAVRTGEGDVDVRSPGNVDVATGDGTAIVRQQGAGGADVVVKARGDVEVVLRSDANLDLRLRGREIRVQTRTVSTVTSRAFERSVGAGSVKVWVDAGYGDVRVIVDED